MDSLDLRYSALQPLLEPYKAKARTESRALLEWYLENIYRLEPTDAQDAVCDGEDDKGIDGIYVDELNSRIDVFQARVVQREDRVVGDTQIKEFAGTLGQFSTAQAVKDLAAATRNTELRELVEDRNVANLVDEGWEVRGVFLTNARTDRNVPGYLANSNANIAMADRDAIVRSYVPSGHVAIISQPATFDIFGYDTAHYQVGGANVIVAPLKATELVQMKGIDSGALFDYNVRQFLGNTAVNKDIVKSVRDLAEHVNFLLYHNGVTIVAGSVDVDDGNKVTIDNYIVVNGCQSLSVFWEQRNHLSDDLRILARIIRIDPTSQLLGTITHHSNNQNGIKPRDFQSNSPVQLRLRNEFDRQYSGRIFYRISRGSNRAFHRL